MTRWPAGTPLDPKAVEAQLRAEGFSCFRWSDSPGTTYGEHSHPHEESLWFIGGHMEMGVLGETYVLGPGDRLVLPKNAVHWARVLGDVAVEYVIGQR